MDVKWWSTTIYSKDLWILQHLKTKSLETEIGTVFCRRCWHSAQQWDTLCNWPSFRRRRKPSALIRTLAWLEPPKVLDREFYEPLSTCRNCPVIQVLMDLSSTASVSCTRSRHEWQCPDDNIPQTQPTTLFSFLSVQKTGFIFAKIHAEDPDFGDNAQLSYLMAKGKWWRSLWHW